jgi:hypothetical protein
MNRFLQGFAFKQLFPSFSAGYAAIKQHNRQVDQQPTLVLSCVNPKK